MNKSMLLAALLCVSTSAFACPELTGKWSCKDSEGKTSVTTVTQEAIPNGVMYRTTDEQGNTQELPVDGVTRTAEDADFTSTMTATCKSSSRIEAKVGMVGKSYDFLVDANIVMELTDPSTLVTTVTGTSSNKAGGDKQPINQSSTCTK